MHEAGVRIVASARMSVVTTATDAECGDSQCDCEEECVSHSVCSAIEVHQMGRRRKVGAPVMIYRLSNQADFNAYAKNSDYSDRSEFPRRPTPRNSATRFVSCCGIKTSEATTSIPAPEGNACEPKFHSTAVPRAASFAAQIQPLAVGGFRARRTRANRLAGNVSAEPLRTGGPDRVLRDLLDAPLAHPDSGRLDASAGRGAAGVVYLGD